MRVQSIQPIGKPEVVYGAYDIPSRTQRLEMKMVETIDAFNSWIEMFKQQKADYTQLQREYSRLVTEHTQLKSSHEGLRKAFLLLREKLENPPAPPPPPPRDEKSLIQLSNEFAYRKECSGYTLLGRHVAEIPFSVRTHNCLDRAEIKTLGQLVKYTEKELLHLKNFGRKSLNEIKAVLAEDGLELRA